ncbi:LPS export ABC transporter permease LptG [Pacificimonas pallii]|nr:LPS export ABC transporter permease LptG [Pacificimonas pallii]
MRALWPSNTLALYQAKMLGLRIIAFAFVLIGMLQMLDLLSESEKILAIPTNGNADLWTYVKLRVPQLADTFLPFSVLLGAIVTWSSLSSSSEIVIMKGAGMSPHQILWPMMGTALIVAIGHFVFAETVLPRTNAELDAWQKADYARMPDDPVKAQFGKWQTAGGDMLLAGRVEGEGADMILSDVEVFRREDKALKEIFEGARAVPDGDGWVLSDARRFDVARGTMREVGSVRVGKGIAPTHFSIEVPDPDEVNSRQLAAAIERMKASGKATDGLETALFQKYCAPLSAILMPLLGAVAGFGLARSGRLFLRAVVGMVLGFAYFVADNAMLAMGEFGAAPPLLAAWGPFVLFFLVGEALLFRTEE